MDTRWHRLTMMRRWSDNDMDILYCYRSMCLIPDSTLLCYVVRDATHTHIRTHTHARTHTYVRTRILFSTQRWKPQIKTARGFSSAYYLLSVQPIHPSVHASILSLGFPLPHCICFHLDLGCGEIWMTKDFQQDPMITKAELWIKSIWL